MTAPIRPTDDAELAVLQRQARRMHEVMGDPDMAVREEAFEALKAAMGPYCVAVLRLTARVRLAEQRLENLRAAAKAVTDWAADPDASDQSPYRLLTVLREAVNAAPAQEWEPPIAIIHTAADGDSSYAATEGVRLLLIDEGSPADRVYEFSTLITAAEIAQIIGDSRIGHAGDIPGVEAEARAFIAREPPPKRPALKVVKGGGE